MNKSTTNLSGLRAAFVPYLHKYRQATAFKGCLVAMILVPCGAILDLIIYPDYLWYFFIGRMVCVCCLACTAFVLNHKLGAWALRLCIFFATYIIVLLMCWMIKETDGGSSSYYAGISLVLYGIGLVLPFTFVEAILFSILTLLSYYTTVFHFSLGEVNMLDYLNNVFFLLLTSVICITAIYFREKQRLYEFSLNYELEQQYEKLAELDQMKSDFFANVSHELRTPLTLILAPIQDLLRTPRLLNDQVASLLYAARDNGLRLLKLVNDLLTVIKLESQPKELQLRTIDLNAFLTGMIESTTYLAETRNLEIVNNIGKEPSYISADPAYLEKIFFNVFSNAIKFTESGSITISMVNSEEQVKVDIIDTGIGINAADLKHIFDRFFQSDSSTTRKYTGTGLGLALVKELMEKLNGEITVRSQIDEGTHITLAFKVEEQPSHLIDSQDDDILHSNDALEGLHHAAELQSVLPMEEPQNMPFFAQHDSQKSRVLIVDDEPGMRRYLTDVLDHEFEVHDCSDGDQALYWVEKWQPKLLLLDLMLPKIDGLELCRRFKGDEKTQAMKIILLTARADDEMKLRALEQGADDFLTKPFSSIELLTRMRNLLVSQALDEEVKQKNTALEEALSNLRNTQQQLLQSEKLNALGSLSAGLLHEVNNPLNFTLTALQMMKMEPLVKGDDNIQEYLVDISEGMERIKAIVTDLRSFAYPSESDVQQPFDIVAAVESALRFTATQVRTVSLSKELAPPYAVLGSMSHIVQVLINLISNAVQAMEGNTSKTLSIKGSVVNERYQIIIKDSGVGMNEAEQKQVFDPFYTTKEVGEGMGMGLSICYTIIKNHDSVLRVESSPAEGASFIFDLTLAENINA